MGIDVCDQMYEEYTKLVAMPEDDTENCYRTYTLVRYVMASQLMYITVNMIEKSVLQVPNTGTQVLDNRDYFCVPDY